MRSYSFAKTPLKAAQAPLVTAKKSQVDLEFGVDMVGGWVWRVVGQWCEMEVPHKLVKKHRTKPIRRR